MSGGGGFLRPEAVAVLRRWREPLIALAGAGVGLWIAYSPGPVMAGFGWVVLAVSGVVFALSLRRVRFARGGDGPGVVTLDERRVAYMGPYYGGVVALDDLAALSLRRAGDGKAYWVLAGAQEVLVIPVNAHGAQAMFDAFTTLPGLSMPFVLRQQDATEPGTVTLWRRTAAPALT